MLKGVKGFHRYPLPMFPNFVVVHKIEHSPHSIDWYGLVGRDMQSASFVEVVGEGACGIGSS